MVRRSQPGLARRENGTMNAESKRILVKAIAKVQHNLAVADARLLAHRGARADDDSLAQALDEAARSMAVLAEGYRASLGALAVLEMAKPRPKTFSQSRPR